MPPTPRPPCSNAPRRCRPGAVREVIVRTGLVAEEIGHAAATEPAGLVVMGLRERGRGMPGGIATAVLKTHNTLVLAVPAI